MDIVCNSEDLYVVSYPTLDAVEVIDKRNGRGGLMRAATAHRFREDLETWSVSADPETFDTFLGQYGALMTQLAVYH